MNWPSEKSIKFRIKYAGSSNYGGRAKILFGEFARLNFPDAAGKQVTNEKVLCMQKVANCPGLF